MARYFLLYNLFKEAYAIDLNEARKQSVKIREMTIFNTQKDIKQNYRLSEELIDQVFGDVKSRNVQLMQIAILFMLMLHMGEPHMIALFFNNCSIPDHLDELVRAGESVYLLGDSGYAQLPYLMVPVQNAQHGTRENYYNQLHSMAINTVEQTIGILKGRFRCLLVHRVLHYDPDMVAKIVIACCVLHNICNSAGLPTLTLQESVQEPETSFHGTSHQVHVEEESSEVAIGQSIHQDLINNLWHARNSYL